MFVLHPVAPTALHSEVCEDEPDLLPQAKIPLYNSVPLFPARAQRAALHLALNRLLNLERRARWRHQHAEPRQATQAGAQTDVRSDQDHFGTTKKRARGDDKASHAYVLYSTADTVLRVDTVPLAIALWRLRLWEGGGWQNAQNADGIYLNHPPSITLSHI